MAPATDTIKIIYNGANKRGFATGPGEAIHFVPGVNNVPKSDWDKLMKNTDPGGVQHFLDNRQMEIAGKSAQESDSIADMSSDDAVLMIENCMTEGELGVMLAQEQGKTSGRGPRKRVLTSITARQTLFDKVTQAMKDEGGSDGGGNSDE